MPAPRSSLQSESVLEKVAASWRRPFLLLVVVAAIAFVLYSSTLSFDFVWDDHLQFASAPPRTLHAVGQAFTHTIWFRYYDRSDNYRPFFIVWSYLNYLLFGAKIWGWHLVAVLLHCATSCSVYLLARRLKMEYWAAGVAALLFAVHPVHIEAVAWVMGSFDALLTLLFVLSVVTYLNARDRRGMERRSWQAVSLLLAACAMLTKEMGVTLPVVILLYEWLELRKENCLGARRVFRSVLAAVPYGLIALAFLAARYWVVRGFATPKSYSLVAVLQTLPLVLFSYIRLLLYPAGLNSFYTLPYVEHAGFTDFVFPLAVVIAVVALIWWWARRTQDKAISFAALWMLATILPALYLPAFSPGDLYRDRYLYLPSVGFVLLAAMALRAIPRRTGERVPVAQVAVVCVIVVALGLGTLMQQVYWANDLLLAYRGFSQSPRNVNSGLRFGSALLDRGEYGRAIDIIKQSVAQNPSYPYGYYTLAIAYLRAGQYDASRQALITGDRLDVERDAPAGLLTRASLYGGFGDYDRAFALFSRLLAIDPDNYEAVHNCGYTYFLAGRYTEAEKYLKRAEELSPLNAGTHFYLGEVFLRTNRIDGAERELRKAISLQPNGEDYHLALGTVLELKGQKTAAAEEYMQELRFYPASAEAQARLKQLNVTP